MYVVFSLLVDIGEVVSVIQTLVPLVKKDLLLNMYKLLFGIKLLSSIAGWRQDELLNLN